MKNLITFLIIRALSPNSKTATEIFKKILDERNPTPKRLVRQPKTKLTPKPKVKKVITQEEELMESLHYFTSKSYQTKEDKEAIRMIKLMLKNRK